MRKFVFVCFLIISAQTAFSQSNKALPYIKKGTEAFNDKDFSKASEYYQKSLKYDNQTAEVFFNLGKIAALNRNESGAIENYQKTIGIDSTNAKFKDAHTYLGLRELRNGDYLRAKELLSFSLRHTPSSTMLYYELTDKIASADMGLKAQKNGLKITPVILPNIINFKGKQYFPVFTADNETMFFTAVEDDGDENIYSASLKNGEFEKPILLKGDINSDANEGTCSISSDGRTMVFTSCEGRNTLGSCDLYIAFKNGDVWSSPENLGSAVNSPYWESQPALSSDGKLLFFASERPGGFGKKDVWFSGFTEGKGWSTAKNVGGKVNTVKDDISPFLHANGTTLFYSSDGQKTFGGFDIFMTNLKDGFFEEPENLGYPINNADDQVSLFVTADGKKAYYAIDNKSKINLFSFDIPKEIEEKYRKVNYLKGIVRDKVTDKPVRATVQLVDLKTQEIVLSTASDSITGNYLAVLPHGKNYGIYVNREGYLFKSLTFNGSESNEADGKVVDILLEPIKKEADIVLSNIFFDSGSADLREESFFELDKLVELLKNNPGIQAEIKGHTDDVGKDVDNLQLSTKRAEAVVAYLLKKAIATNRLEAKGLGETQPLVSNDSDENRQRNRRIEFRIL